MSMWSRIANVLRGDGFSARSTKSSRRIWPKRSGKGRDPAEARRAFGSFLRNREESL